MYYLEDYSRLVIEPLEDFKKEVIRKYIKSFFFKKSYEEAKNYFRRITTDITSHLNKLGSNIMR